MNLFLSFLALLHYFIPGSFAGDNSILKISEFPVFDFGSAECASPHTFTVTNAGTTIAKGIQPGTFTAPFVYVGGNYPGIGGTCNDRLSPGASCTLVVEFAPAEVGSYQDVLRLYYTAGPRELEADRPLTGSANHPN